MEIIKKNVKKWDSQFKIRIKTKTNPLGLNEEQRKNITEKN
jgi:hypothetical protein